jgi:Sugar-specific transcriptional regulator TrmB
MRSEAFSMLEELEPGGVLVIDAKGIEVFDYSFANELFGKTVLSMAGEFQGRFVVVEHLTTYTHENLAKAMESLGLTIAERKKGKIELLGKVHPADSETFSVLVGAKEPVSAVELSKRLNVNLTAMNERLSKLMSMGLARRTKTTSSAGREQYEYSAFR